MDASLTSFWRSFSEIVDNRSCVVAQSFDIGGLGEVAVFKLVDLLIDLQGCWDEFNRPMLDPSRTMRGRVGGKGKEGGCAFHAMSKPSMCCRSLREFKSFREFEVLSYLNVAYSLADFAERFLDPGEKRGEKGRQGGVKMLHKFILFHVQGIASTCPSSSHTTRPEHSVIKDEITLGFERGNSEGEFEG